MTFLMGLDDLVLGIRPVRLRVFTPSVKKRPFRWRPEMAASSALCAFGRRRIMLAQRMAGLTGRTAALVGDDQWLQRAVSPHHPL